MYYYNILANWPVFGGRPKFSDNVELTEVICMEMNEYSEKSSIIETHSRNCTNIYYTPIVICK